MKDLINDRGEESVADNETVQYFQNPGKRCCIAVLFLIKITEKKKYVKKTLFTVTTFCFHTKY